MAGTLNQAELLKLFPHKSLPTVAHGRKRSTKVSSKMLHGRSRGHSRGHLPSAATRDPFHGKARASGQR